jgi:flagellar hook-associated protein 3 FlgL
MMVAQFLQNLNANMTRLSTSNEQLSTGKRIQRPSDDPVAVAKSLSLRTRLVETETFMKNVDEATSWMDSVDSSLDGVNQIMTRAKEIAVAGANGTLGQQSRDALADEVDTLLQNAIQLGNTDHGGRFIFGGFMTTAAPFTYNTVPAPSVTYNGDGNSIKYEVSSGITVGVNVPGDAAFNPVFTSLINLSADLRSGNTASISNADIGQIDTAVDNLLEYRAEIGARTNQIDLTKNRLLELKTNFSKLLSENEDVDVAETIMNLKMQENVYRAALDTGSRILQPTLMDFLR